VATIIRLQGRPAIEVSGRPQPAPRGAKTWAVLAFVTLCDGPPPRRRVADLLFADADDPLGALRWALAELRRAVGHGLLAGDPLVLDLPPGMSIDVLERADSGLTGELLAGLRFRGCDSFETWLLVERRRLASAAVSRLRESALRSLGAGQADQATSIAARLVELEPLQDSHHALLVRGLTVAGHHEQAQQAAEACEELFQRELGTMPSRQVRDALLASPASPSAAALGGAAAATAQLTAGTAAISAGAVSAGIDCLRRAVEEARYANEEALLAAALTELGTALVHAVRGRDEEGASTLHEALHHARTSRSPMTATICRELAFVDVQAGRGGQADAWLSQARELAARRGDDRQLAAIDGVAGMNHSDQADYPTAQAVLTDSVSRALHCNSRRQAAWSASLLGRLHLLRGEHDAARVALQQSLELVDTERWVAFLPWPASLHAEIDRIEGRTGRATRQLQESFALACQLADPCWEGTSKRSLVLCEIADPAQVVEGLSDARARCVRWPDTYQWVHAYILDAMCMHAAQAGDPKALHFADELLALSAKTNYREYIVRAHLHRAALGEPGAAVAAHIAATGIDNPQLEQAVTAAQ
jgi:DNA-binding SARP family transcriptional activator